MADFFTIPADRLHAVPDDLDDLTAALIEPLSTPVHAVRLAGDVAGRSVAVLGAGPIGLLVLAVVRAHGARRVVVTDVLPAKRERALSLGADDVVDAAAADVADQVRAALGESADVVFDCVAVQATVTQAVALASKGGTVVVVGVPARDVTVPLPVIQDHQIRDPGQRHLPGRGLPRVDQAAADRSGPQAGPRHGGPRAGRRGGRLRRLGRWRAPQGPDRRVVSVRRSASADVVDRTGGEADLPGTQPGDQLRDLLGPTEPAHRRERLGARQHRRVGAGVHRGGDGGRGVSGSVQRACSVSRSGVRGGCPPRFRWARCVSHGAFMAGRVVPDPRGGRDLVDEVDFGVGSCALVKDGDRAVSGSVQRACSVSRSGVRGGCPPRVRWARCTRWARSWQVGWFQIHVVDVVWSTGWISEWVRVRS